MALLVDADVVALSTHESEFYTAARSAQEGIANIKLSEELGIETVESGITQEDNMTCIWYSEHSDGYEKSKHIRRNFYFVEHLSVEHFEFFRAIIMYLWSSVHDM